ncbi:MAG TPA: helix-turn-helix transcriptional regulator [Bacteroidia bacterium]|jgi:putative transcriptional regulator|nr:helix-turn-helix transcriptional regulator [Bacteroidia bacterium]
MNRIKEVLKDQGRSQTWLASRIGERYARVSGYCNNKRHMSTSILYRIAGALGVSAQELRPEEINTLIFSSKMNQD